jgi:DNA polymerase-3 subunit delta'
VAAEVGNDTAASALPWHPLLPWQRAAAVAALAERAQFPHALLVHGARGIGKHALALNLAQALLCESPAADGLACATCASCRYAIAGQHPDLMRIELAELQPEGDYKRVDTITIERIRDLIDFAQLTSHRQRAKVAVIAPADRMNEPAANALLKTLEEPPPSTYALLVAEQPARLAPTIVSRCRRLAAPRPSDEEARAWLAAQGVQHAGIALAQAAGAPLAALALADPAAQSERATWLAALAKPDRLPVIALAERVERAAKDERKAQLALALDCLIGWTCDLALAAAGAAPRFNPDRAADIAALAARVAPLPLFRYHRSLLRRRAAVAHPLQPRLVAEAALLDYQSIFR